MQQKTTNFPKIKESHEENLIEMAINFDSRYNRYFYNGVSLQKYCLENNINFHKKLSKIKQKLNAKNTQNKFAILYSKNKVLVCDYNSSPDVRGRYDAKYYPLDYFDDEE